MALASFPSKPILQLLFLAKAGWMPGKEAISGPPTCSQYIDNGRTYRLLLQLNLWLVPRIVEIEELPSPFSLLCTGSVGGHHTDYQEEQWEREALCVELPGGCHLQEYKPIWM